MSPTRYQRRFMQHVKLSTEAQQHILQQMYPHIESTWSLGCIPWYGWRMPILKITSEVCAEHIEIDLLDDALDALNNAMANTKVETFCLPTRDDANELLRFLKSTLHEDDYGDIERDFTKTLDIIRNTRSINYNEMYCISTNEVHTEFSIFHEKTIFFHASVLAKVLKELAVTLTNNNELFSLISHCTCLCIAKLPLCVPGLYRDCCTGVDDTNKSVATYDFWSWQYTQRNSDYISMLSIFTSPVDDSPPFISVPRYDLFEYFDISPIDVISNSSTAVYFNKINALIEDCVKTFGYKPTWPIHGYTSEYILPRMISGTFRVYERESPIKMNYCKDNVFACSHDPMDCAHYGVDDQPQCPGSISTRVCDPECLEKVSRTEFERLCRIIHKERGKIRSEGLHRMLGLWIWDYCQAHKEASVQNAIDALISAHFPKINPEWKPKKSNEAKKGEEWHDYRERFLDTRKLYHDYTEACRCVDAHRFMSKRTR